MKKNIGKSYTAIAVNILVIFIIIFLSAKIFYQSQYSNGLFSKSLRNSEGMTLNGGTGFAVNGFMSNGGLPDIRFNRSASDHMNNKFIKLTYPPGPHWLAGLYIKICGFENDACYRIFPAALGIISLFIFAWVVLSVFEPVKSALMMLSLAVAPATIIMMHGLTYLTYSSTLFLVQLALLLKIFKENPGDDKKHLYVLFAGGAIQGLFSWDYLFLICFSAIPFALLYFQDTKEYRHRILFIVLACSSGFLFAHFLHIIQVVIYKGGIMAAYEPLYLKMMNRFDGSFTTEIFHFDEGRLRILFNYLNIYASSEFFFKVNFLKFLIMSCILMFISKAELTFWKPLQINIYWRPSSNNLLAIVSAFIISSLWIFTMKQHAYFHPDFHPMHLYLLYFICILAILESMSFSADFSNSK